MQIVNKIAIDLQRRQVLPQIDAVQNDTLTRAVKVALYDGGSAWTPPADCTASLAFHKADGTGGWYDNLPTGEAACSVSGNEVTAVLAPQVLTVPGKVKVVVVFQDVNLARLATFPFYIMVEADPAANTVKSDNYYNLQSLDQVNAAVGDLQKQLDGLIKVDDTVVSSAATWSSKNTIDQLCPAFTRTGTLVQCEPVEGYPLDVVTELPVSEAGYNAITLTRCGKNLFDYTQTKFTNHYIFWNNKDGREGQTTSSTGYSASGYIPVSNLQGQTITLNHPPIEAASTGNAGMAFYDANKEVIIGYGTNGYTAVVPDNAQYMRFSVPRAYADGTAVQIELGSAVTAFEAYREPQVFTAEFPAPVYGGSYSWASGLFANGTGSGKQQPVIARSGVNTFYSSHGTTLVVGKADPVAAVRDLTEEISSLKKAVLSLGGNI